MAISSRSASMGLPPWQSKQPRPAQKASAAFPELSTSPPSIGKPMDDPPVMYPTWEDDPIKEMLVAETPSPKSTSLTYCVGVRLWSTVTCAEAMLGKARMTRRNDPSLGRLLVESKGILMAESSWGALQDKRSWKREDPQLKSANDADNFFRAWKMRDLTVPMGISISAAISS